MAKKNAKKAKNEIKKRFPVKTLVNYAAPVIAIIILISAGYLFLKNSGYFKIEDIEVRDTQNAAGLAERDLLNLYKGRNIFGVDIAALSSRIKSDYPAIKDAVVKRILPNRLEIDITPRIPVAKVKARRYFPIDETGMVLSPGLKSQKLPVIIGFSTWRLPSVGERLHNKQLESAFQLLDAMQKGSVSADYNVTTIDVSNHENLSFYLENGIEVKIGGEDFLTRLGQLKATLKNEKLDKDNIRYIDLRFKDVVIGPK